MMPAADENGEAAGSLTSAAAHKWWRGSRVNDVCRQPRQAWLMKIPVEADDRIGHSFRNRMA